MRSLFLFLFSFVCFTASSQKKVSKHKLIVFNTYEDYLAEKGQDYGFVTGRGFPEGPGNKIFVLNGEKKDKGIKVDKVWGFQIGKYLFRMNQYTINLPMLVLYEKEKLFYIDGYLFLDKAMFDEDTGFSYRKSDGVFYSDNLNSEVFEISKMIKKEKDNPKLKEMIECLKDAKERVGIQSKYNGYVECIQK